MLLIYIYIYIYIHTHVYTYVYIHIRPISAKIFKGLGFRRVPARSLGEELPRLG